MRSELAVVFKESDFRSKLKLKATESVDSTVRLDDDIKGIAVRCCRSKCEPPMACPQRMWLRHCFTYTELIRCLSLSARG